MILRSDVTSVYKYLKTPGRLTSMAYSALSLLLTKVLLKTAGFTDLLLVWAIPVVKRLRADVSVGVPL